MSESTAYQSALRVLVVDDEALARSRLKTLLADCQDPPVVWVGEAGSAVQAMDFLSQHEADVILADIHMPGSDGMALAKTLQSQHATVSVVFVTAHAEHALEAFELNALDYLTKPVRLARLQTALHKVARLRSLPSAPTALSASSDDVLIVHERGGVQRVALNSIIYLKAELKYITVRTAQRHYLMEGSLSDFETRFAQHFVRVHRNALVAKKSVLALERRSDALRGWVVRLASLSETLPISRRQMSLVKALLEG